MKPTFATRTLQNNTQAQTIDALAIINYFKSLNPNIIIIPNSYLYNLAITQYNESIKNTLDRPPIPNWFCGYLNPTTGELLNNETDQTIRYNNGVIIDNPALTTTTITLTGAYEQDNCLTQGTPGSYGYSLCEENTIEENKISGINWYDSISSTPAGLYNTNAAISTILGKDSSGNNTSSATLQNQIPVTKLPVDAQISSLKISKNSTSWRIVSGTTNWKTTIIKKPVQGQTHYYVFRNGKWGGGKFDWFAPKQQTKDHANIYGNYMGIIPRSGEKVAFVLTDITKSKRSNILQGVWP